MYLPQQVEPVISTAVMTRTSPRSTCHHAKVAPLESEHPVDVRTGSTSPSTARPESDVTVSPLEVGRERALLSAS